MKKEEREALNHNEWIGDRPFINIETGGKLGDFRHLPFKPKLLSYQSILDEDCNLEEIFKINEEDIYYPVLSEELFSKEINLAMLYPLIMFNRTYYGSDNILYGITKYYSDICRNIFKKDRIANITPFYFIADHFLIEFEEIISKEIFDNRKFDYLYSISDELPQSSRAVEVKINNLTDEEIINLMMQEKNIVKEALKEAFTFNDCFLEELLEIEDVFYILNEKCCNYKTKHNLYILLQAARDIFYE